MKAIKDNMELRITIMNLEHEFKTIKDRFKWVRTIKTKVEEEFKIMKEAHQKNKD